MRKAQKVMAVGIGLGLFLLPLFSGTAWAASEKILKIGNTVPLQTKEGVQIKRWLDLLTDRLNKAGGLEVKGEKYNVQVITYDDEYSADAGRAAAERLVFQDKVKHIICQWGSAPIVATLQIAEANKVLQIANGMTDKSMEPQWHYFYRCPSLYWDITQYVVFMEEFMKRNLAKTVVSICPDDVTGRGHAKQKQPFFEHNGIKILDQLFYKRGTTDYTPFATKIKSMNPGIVDTGPTIGGAPTLLLAKALHEVGYKGGVIYNNMSESWKEIVQKHGPEVIEGACGGFKDPREYRKQGWVQELCDAYEKKYGVWETDATMWIGGWFVFLDAVKKANSLDVDDLCKTLENMEFKTLYADGKFVARPDYKNPRKCDGVSEQFPGVMKNGKFQLMKIVSPDDNYRLSIKAIGKEQEFGLK